jgi:outer membrane protein TolC
MAEVRSIEQQYWNLAQAHVQLWSADRAVSLAQEILNREEAELMVGRGTIADVAEAAQRLEQFTLDLVTRTSDVITTERQLRNLLGLPPADNRRIIPVTPPTEARLEPDWDSSLAQMLSFQPDIVQQQILVRVAELQLLIARNQLLPQLSLNALYQFNGLGQQLDSAEAVMTGATLKALNPVIANQQRAAGLNQNPGSYNNFITWQVGFTLQMPLGMRYPLANTRQAQYILLRSRAYLQQVVHQTTHSLARFFLEIDANYKQFKTASRLRAAAAQRLDAQRAYYEEGRITIDRFLDAVSQYATAVATEAQYKTTYNISIVALEEAKGTLLAYDNIAVAEGPQPRKAYIQARDIQNAHKQHHILPDGPMMPYKPVSPGVPDPTNPNPPPNADEPNLPPMPAPIGPLGPAPGPLPPHVPASEKPFLSRNGSGAGAGSGGATAAASNDLSRGTPDPSSGLTLTSGDGAPPSLGTASSATGSRISSSAGMTRGGTSSSSSPGGGSFSSVVRAATPAPAQTQPAGGSQTPAEDLPPLPINMDLPPLPAQD